MCSPSGSTLTRAATLARLVDGTEIVIDELRLVADRHQRDRLLALATRFEPRTWAIEGAGGLGALLAQQLVAAGETVLDVARRCRLGCGWSTRPAATKPTPQDARAAAIVAMRHDRLRRVAPVDHSAVLRLLADRHHDLTALRTQAICRLHALLCQLTGGGASGRLSAQRAGQVLRGIGPLEPLATAHKRIALDLLGDVRRFDSQLVTPKPAPPALKRQISNAVYRQLHADTRH